MKLMRTTVASIVAATFSLTAVSAFAAASLTGAGATFPAPVYAKWADSYQKETGNKVNYQGIGSSGGVKQIVANTVDFGASDAPLSDDKLAADGLFQFPTVIGGVVLAVNIPGIKSGELTLDGKTLGDIYLGNVKKWNDPAITKLNPGVKLPDQNIAVVRRADGSGTSFVFTSYLSKVNAQWKEKIGSASAWLYRLRRIRLRQAEQPGLHQAGVRRRQTGQPDRRELQQRRQRCGLEQNLRSGSD
jgi:phosphate transport system substrate-binding protein